MSADRELIERARERLLYGSATSGFSNEDTGRLLALASAGADMDGALPIGVSEVAEALRAARLAGVEAGLEAAASVATEWASGPTCDPSGEPCKCKRTADSIETRIRGIDAAAVAARGRG